MTDYERMIRVLASERVDFIIVGGAAATAHGSGRLTEDLDIVYSRDGENLARLATALTPLAPRLRGKGEEVPFLFDEESLRKGMNFTLATSAGDLDLFGELSGGFTFENLAGDCVDLVIFGNRCRCLSLPKLIQVKEAAKRPKDLEAVAELRAILAERTT
jgi:predicted nucleotidyltransferase